MAEARGQVGGRLPSLILEVRALAVIATFTTRSLAWCTPMLTPTAQDDSQARFVRAVKGMLARPDYLIPLAAAERQFRDQLLRAELGRAARRPVLRRSWELPAPDRAKHPAGTASHRPERLGLR